MLKRIYKISAWVVLLTFGFQAMGGNVWASVIRAPEHQNTRAPEKTIGEEWVKAIKGLEGLLEESGKRGFQIQESKLNDKKKEIEKLDEKLRKEFKETEEFLKEKKLPDKILQRHYDFVKQYNENYKKLKEGIENAKKGKTKELREFLEKAQYKEKPKPLDPNKLPHRLAPQIKSKEPRTKEAISRKLSAVSTEDYLKETIDVQITDEIRRLATETLKSNPVLIYEYVRNNFDYEPYYGSLKGSQQTLWEKAGNDFDLASLLIALYRSCNIPARYVYGTIEIPIEKAMNWVGVKDPYTAAQIFASGGIPSKAITSGGKIVAIRLEHCWIEVYIAYLPYSGAKDWDKGDKIWIPVDSSFKQYESPKDGTYTDTETGQTISIKNLDISDKVLFDNEGYLKGTSTIFPVFEYLNNTQDWLLSNTPPNTFYNIFSAKTIIPESAEVLPGLPNKPLSILNRYSEIPDNLRHKISFSGNISYTARTIELASKRITLSYKGASSSDEDTIKSYGNLYNTPAYLVELIPQLRINGETKASGNPIPMAEDEAISLTFIDPGRPSEIITKNIISGGYYAFGLLLSRIPGEAIETTSNRFSESYKTKPLYNSFGLLEDDIMGEALYFSSLNWLYQTEAGERIASSLLNVITQRQAEITSEIATERDWLWGMPSKLNLMGISVDVGRDTSIVNPIDNDQTKIKKFITITLYNGSVNEHLTLDIPMGTITGVSGVKAIQISNQQGISIYKIDKTNIGSILPILQQDADVKGAIQDSVSAGNEVIIPEREITYYGFQGTGYIIQDPVTGAGACMISGGAAGAESLITMGVFVDLFEIFIENTALVIQGEDISILPVLESIPYWYSSFMALGAIYFLGYNPIYMRIHTKETYLNEVAKSKYKILYHCGHGAKDGGLILDNELLIKTGYNGYVDASHINSIDTNHYKFVYIDSCYGASVAQAFKSTCQLSYTDWVFGVISIDFAQWFWLGMILGNLTVKESYEDAKSGFIPIFLPIKLYGNGDINLKTK